MKRLIALVLAPSLVLTNVPVDAIASQLRTQNSGLREFSELRALSSVPGQGTIPSYELNRERDEFSSSPFSSQALTERLSSFLGPFGATPGKLALAQGPEGYGHFKSDKHRPLFMATDKPSQPSAGTPGTTASSLNLPKDLLSAAMRRHGIVTTSDLSLWTKAQMRLLAGRKMSRLVKYMALHEISFRTISQPDPILKEHLILEAWPTTSEALGKIVNALRGVGFTDWTELSGLQNKELQSIPNLWHWGINHLRRAQEHRITQRLDNPPPQDPSGPILSVLLIAALGVGLASHFLSSSAETAGSAVAGAAKLAALKLGATKSFWAMGMAITPLKRYRPKKGSPEQREPIEDKDARLRIDPAPRQIRIQAETLQKKKGKEGLESLRDFLLGVLVTYPNDPHLLKMQIKTLIALFIANGEDHISRHDAEMAVRLAARALRIERSMNNTSSASREASALATLAKALYYAGDLDSAEETAIAARDRDTQNQFGLSILNKIQWKRKRLHLLEQGIAHINGLLDQRAQWLQDCGNDLERLRTLLREDNQRTLYQDLRYEAKRDGFEPDLATRDQYPTQLVPDLTDYAIDLFSHRRPLAAAYRPRAAALMLDYYLFLQLSLISLRVWDRSNPQEGLTAVQQALDRLQQGTGYSGTLFARHAATLPALATSQINLTLEPYRKLMLRARALPSPWSEQLIEALTLVNMQHVRSQPINFAQSYYVPSEMERYYRLNSSDYMMLMDCLTEWLARYQKSPNDDHLKQLIFLTLAADPEALLNPERLSTLIGQSADMSATDKSAWEIYYGQRLDIYKSLLGRHAAALLADGPDFYRTYETSGWITTRTIFPLPLVSVRLQDALVDAESPAIAMEDLFWTNTSLPLQPKAVWMSPPAAAQRAYRQDIFKKIERPLKRMARRWSRNGTIIHIVPTITAMILLFLVGSVGFFQTPKNTPRLQASA